MFDDATRARFEAKYVRGRKNECWLWIASKNDGYGSFRYGPGGMHKAHRISYQMYVGDIPEGLCVCHECDNRACVNPNHLWLGTRDDNMKDMVAKGRQWRPIGDKHPLYGKHHSEASKRKMAASRRSGWHHSPETRAKIAASHVGKRHSEEAKAKMRAAKLRSQEKGK